MKDLNKEYKKLVLEYCSVFCDRHQTEFVEKDQPIDWLEHGIIFIDDEYINLDDIRYDVDNNIPVGVFERWYSRSVECSELDIVFPNFSSYSKGAPCLSDESLKRIKDQHDQIVKMTIDLKNQILEINKSNS